MLSPTDAATQEPVVDSAQRVVVACAQARRDAAIQHCLEYLVSRCESLVLYRIMYGNRVMEVQRRNNFVVGSDNTELISWGPGVCWGHGGIKLNN